MTDLVVFVRHDVVTSIPKATSGLRAMARQPKTYVTTSGFFELAVAAPTKKAALEIWGGGRDLFQRGYAKETSDPAIVKATLAKPGVVLQRGVGGRGAFREKAELPDVSAWEKPVKKSAVSKPSAVRKSQALKPKVADPAVEAAQKKRERDETRIEAAEKRASERRERATQKAAAALKAAQDAHNRNLAAVEEDRAKLDRRAQEETERWRSERAGLEAALQKARS